MIRKKYAVVVVTYGEVEHVTIKNLWPTSRKILKTVTRQIANIPEALINIIADFRSLKHYAHWKWYHYHSSLTSLNRRQAEALKQTMQAQGGELFAALDVDVYDACYFVAPYFEEVIQQLQAKYAGVVVVPMFPVESAFSCGIACQMAYDYYGLQAFTRLTVLSRLWKDVSLHQLYTRYLFEQLAVLRSSLQGKKIGLVLVIHGTIVRDRNGNPPKIFTGLDETMAFFQVMKQAIEADKRNIFCDIRIGCMNHSRGGEWTSDTIEKAFSEFHQQECDGVVMFPFGFFADNSETEYDAYRKLEHSGFTHYHYIRCINDYQPFAEWLGATVLQRVQALYHAQTIIESSQPQSIL